MKEIPSIDRPKDPELEAKLKATELTEEERRAIEDLEEPLRNILRSLGHELSIGTYDLMIGDDAAGRISAYMVWNAAKSLVPQHQGVALPLRFFAGSRNLSEHSGGGGDKKAAIKEYLIAQFKAAPKKVLIVTDTLATGGGLTLLIKALKEIGSEVDIATFGIVALPDELEAYREKLERRLGARIICGRAGTPLIFRPIEYGGGKEANGVVKKSEALFAEVNDTPPLRVAAARALAKDIAKRTADTLT
ncbi:MAG: hypothetical protein WA021_02065 [Minisyncoccia bacterium]